LCFAGVLSLAVSGYLAISYRSLVVSNRELDSSHCMELAEIGMDEALWSLNNNHVGSDWTGGGWIISGSTATKTLNDPQYPLYPDPASQPFSYDNGAKGQVAIIITSYQTTPVITTSGTMSLANGTVITRRLRSNAGPAQLFTNAIGAIGSLVFVNGGTVDSYSAVDPLIAGTYTYGFNAVVSGATVDLGNAAINGFAATQGTPIQSRSAAKVTGSSSGTDIDSSRVSQHGTQPLYDVANPTSVIDRYDPITSSTQLTNSDTLNAAGTYRYDSILLDGSKTLTIDAPVVLKVTNYVYIGSGSQIHVTTNGSLQLEIDASAYSPTPDTTGNVTNSAHLPQGLYMVGGGIANDSQVPEKVSVLVGGSYIADADPHSYTYIDTSLPFYGSIYTPNDNVTVAANDFVLYGAMIGKNISFTGTLPAIHYDSNLLSSSIPGIVTPFALVQLRELSPGEL
jgi:hypothetical protein